MNFRKYDIPDEEPAAKKLLEELLTPFDEDIRPAMWLVSGAASHFADKIEQEELNCCRHQAFGRTQEAEKSRLEIARYTTYIRILGCLHTILFSEELERSAQSVREIFGGKTRKRGK